MYPEICENEPIQMRSHIYLTEMDQIRMWISLLATSALANTSSNQ